MASHMKILEEVMKEPKFNLFQENDSSALQKQRNSLEWVVRVFPDVQTGIIGLGYFYNVFLLPVQKTRCFAMSL